MQVLERLWWQEALANDREQIGETDDKHKEQNSVHARARKTSYFSPRDLTYHCHQRQCLSKVKKDVNLLKNPLENHLCENQTMSHAGQPWILVLHQHVQDTLDGQSLCPRGLSCLEHRQIFHGTRLEERTNRVFHIETTKADDMILETWAGTVPADNL